MIRKGIFFKSLTYIYSLQKLENMTNTTEIIAGLNDLLEKTYDAEKGYKSAKENSDSDRLKTFFGARSQQRYQYGHTLKEEIKKLGGTPEKGGSMVGTAHRAWIDFKSTLALSTEEAILEECERGEEASLKAYDEFLNTHKLSSSLASEIFKQRNGIARSLNKVEILEEQFDA